MKIHLLIADSGGTKTDWCFISENGTKKFFTTASFHPRNILALNAVELSYCFKEFTELKELEVYFFGAGCLNEDKATELIVFLKSLGFNNVTVQSDILAAGLALNGGNGWGAICGTGSVVFELKNGQLLQLIGGTGRETGDEGSGYYFGKLLVKEIHQKRIDSSTFKELENVELIPENYGDFAHLLATHKNHPVIELIHRKNIQLFTEKYLPTGIEISIAGSYSFFHQAFFKEELEKKSIKVVRFIHKPIEELTDYFLNSTD